MEAIARRLRLGTLSKTAQNILRLLNKEVPERSLARILHPTIARTGTVDRSRFSGPMRQLIDAADAGGSWEFRLPGGKEATALLRPLPLFGDSFQIGLGANHSRTHPASARAYEARIIEKTSDFLSRGSFVVINGAIARNRPPCRRFGNACPNRSTKRRNCGAEAKSGAGPHGIHLRHRRP